MNLRINNVNFKDNKSTATTTIFAIFFPKINPDVHVSTKINTFTCYKDVCEGPEGVGVERWWGGGGGNNPHRSQRNSKKSNKFEVSRAV